MSKTKIERSADTYDLELSGKLGSRVDLETVYVEQLAGMSASGRQSLRLALFAYKTSGQDPAAWNDVVAAQAVLETIKEQLFAAGYTPADLTKLAMDNT